MHCWMLLADHIVINASHAYTPPVVWHLQHPASRVHQAVLAPQWAAHQVAVAGVDGVPVADAPAPSRHGAGGRMAELFYEQTCFKQ